VFSARKLHNKRLEFAAFGVIGIIGLGLLAILMWLLTDIAGVHYLLSKVIVTGVVFFWNSLPESFSYSIIESNE
jgi:putative flippase GtrA